MLDVGTCRERAVILDLREAESGVFAWYPSAPIWLRAEKQRGRNLFSAVGIGVESWRFTARKRDISLHSAIRWRGEHYFLTAVSEPERGWVELEAARIEPRTVRLLGDKGWTGPVCMTEKYLGHEQTQAPAILTETMVAVAPKTLDCRSGDLLEADGKIYRVTVVHRTDPCKNEFELVWEGDA